ncbi:MAG: MarR family transcriptional regulator [Desulfobacterales bacterium]|nr:MarR family transcriptional regulator [Desulfobacterales bacterium]MCP4159626.1 MarR family transcriptional regulator [Deltaproteobacteria bacterium]
MKTSELGNDQDIKKKQLCSEVLILLRKINQAIDLHSKDLNKKYGLTGPQLIILQEISHNSGLTITGLAKRISLSQGTVTDIVYRLEKKGFLKRVKSTTDKRKTELYVTTECEKVLDKAPPPLQETFIDHFTDLKDWEQFMILSSLQRIVDMMSAKKIDVSPILVSGPLLER